MAKKKSSSKYVHKQDRNLFITPVDHHFCQTACVKTFASGSVWDAYDHHMLFDRTGFELYFDFERCDNEHRMRAYKEQKSGVLILETGLWDYQNRCSDFDNLSVFQEKSAEDIPVEVQKEEYHFIVSQDFSIRGFDDLGRIAHDLICIPKGTKFTWVKENLNLTNPMIRKDVPVWHMTSLRNAEIGIEIDFPTRYIGLVMVPIDKTMEMPKDITPYPHYASCRKCNKLIGVPYEDTDLPDEIFVYDDGPEDDFSDYDCEEDVLIENWFCDKCYQDIFRSHQHTWSFQTKKDCFDPVW